MPFFNPSHRYLYSLMTMTILLHLGLWGLSVFFNVACVPVLKNTGRPVYEARLIMADSSWYRCSCSIVTHHPLMLNTVGQIGSAISLNQKQWLRCIVISLWSRTNCTAAKIPFVVSICCGCVVELWLGDVTSTPILQHWWIILLWTVTNRCEIEKCKICNLRRISRHLMLIDLCV